VGAVGDRASCGGGVRSGDRISQEGIATSGESDGVSVLRVHQVTWEAEDTVSLRLMRADGGVLPAWGPGAHLDVVLPSGLVRQYSLCGDLEDRCSYRVAVLREANSRGGSREIFESALVGRSLTVRGPRNHFELVEGPAYCFVAGGIGITPIVPMVQAAERADVPWRLVYGGRSRASMAFVEELAARSGGEVILVPQDSAGLVDVESVVRSLGDALLYACGPPGLLAALQERCAAAAVADRFHFERFTAGQPAAVEVAADALDEFEIELRRSGVVAVVRAGQSVLDVVRELVPGVLYSCEEGYCGSCEQRVLEGTPDHRDSVLSERERAENNTMMICVSRSKSPRLVLDV
jgi:ferredoxin-NADP reductase